MSTSKDVLETLEKNLPEMLDGALEAKLKDLNAEIVALKEAKADDVEITEKEIAGAVFKGIQVSMKGWDTEAITKAMGEEVANGWAELVFDYFSNDVSAVFDDNKIASRLTKEGAANSYKYIKPKFDGDSITSFKVGENNVATASDAQTSNVVITINKRVILTNLSEEILKDNMTIPTLYQLLVKTIGVEYASAIENEVINWNGTLGDIEGLFVDANVNSTVMDAGKTTFEDVSDNDIVKLVTSTEDKYGSDDNNVLVMSKSIKGVLMNLKTTTGAVIYPELRTNGTILGYEVITSTKTPKSTDAVQLDTPFIAFGNFEHITLAENGAEEIILGYNGEGFAKSQKTLRATKRDGLGVIYPKAFAKLVTAAA